MSGSKSPDNNEQGKERAWQQDLVLARQDPQEPQDGAQVSKVHTSDLVQTSQGVSAKKNPN